MNNQDDIMGGVIDFFSALDRSLFLEDDYRDLAGYDRPLPIGYEQTISQPTLVLQMTQLLKLNKDLKVLEIGTGSGYQTAFLAEFAREVYTVERIKALSVKAQQRLAKLGYQNIKFKIGDGSEGWRDFEPYDRIIVTAGAGQVPGPLLEQLKPNGMMILPVGERSFQELMIFEKNSFGKIESRSVGEVRFVELKGQFGWDSKGPSEK